MAYISAVPRLEASAELEGQYDEAADRSALNVARVQSLGPLALAASSNMFDVVMFGEGPLSRAERSMIAVVVSSANNCFYDAHRHACELRKLFENKVLVAALQEDYRTARVDARTRIILDFAVLVTKDVHLVTKVTVQEMLYDGLTEEEVLAVVQVTAFINYENRLVDALGADAEDYMPRQPR